MLTLKGLTLEHRQLTEGKTLSMLQRQNITLSKHHTPLICGFRGLLGQQQQIHQAFVNLKVNTCGF